MVDNLAFLDHPHFCIVCNKNIDMNEVKRYVIQSIREEVQTGNIIVVDDHGNDVSLCCGINCYREFIERG